MIRALIDALGRLQLAAEADLLSPHARGGWIGGPRDDDTAPFWRIPREHLLTAEQAREMVAATRAQLHLPDETNS